MRRLPTGRATLCCFLLLLAPVAARSESTGAREFAPGEHAVRRSPAVARSERAERVARHRALARAHSAEIDSLSAHLAASPEEAGRYHREIEAAKRRHAHETVVLQREFALRAGDLALVRKLETRLTRLAGAEAGAR